MTKEQKKALARIFKRQAQLLADMPALMSLLETYAKTKTVPTEWKKHLAYLQSLPEYKEVLAEFEPAISRLESAADDDDLIELYEQMSRGKLPN